MTNWRIVQRKRKQDVLNVKLDSILTEHDVKNVMKIVQNVHQQILVQNVLLIMFILTTKRQNVFISKMHHIVHQQDKDSNVDHVTVDID